MEYMRNQELDVYVKDWADYSEKYGLGYMLSNMAMGVHFNDGTKMVIDPNLHHFFFKERKSYKDNTTGEIK